jgi:hypothetical protein
MQEEKIKEIIKKFGVIKTEKTGWTLEVRLINWNNKKPKIDFRCWDPADSDNRCSKGFTLHYDELENLENIIKSIPRPALTGGNEKNSRE